MRDEAQANARFPWLSVRRDGGFVVWTVWHPHAYDETLILLSAAGHSLDHAVPEWLSLSDPSQIPSNDDRQLDLVQCYHRERASLDAEVELTVMLKGGDWCVEEIEALRRRVRDEAESLYAASMQTPLQD